MVKLADPELVNGLTTPAHDQPINFRGELSPTFVMADALEETCATEVGEMRSPRHLPLPCATKVQSHENNNFQNS